MTKYAQKTNQTTNNNKMNDFLLKSIDKYGSEASILLSFANIGREDIEFIEKMYQKNSEVYFDFINSSVVLTLLGFYNEHKNTIMKQSEEIAFVREKNDQLESEISSLKTQLSSMQKEKESEISSLEKRLIC